MNRLMPFVNWNHINKKAKNRDVVFFGSGNIAEKTSQKIPDIDVVKIVDNASNLWGSTFNGIEVTQPDYLIKLEKKPFIIITSTSFREIYEQLEIYNYIPHEDFALSPILNDLRIIDELETIERELIFTSGSPKVNSPTYGGGVYKLVLHKDEYYHEKKISGNCYGLAKYNDNYITVDTEKGIVEFDNNFNIIREAKLPLGARAHGVTYSKENKLFYVACSYRDSIIILNNDFSLNDEIKISFKRNRYKKASHHCNDCYLYKDSLYVSMFSLTGNWKLDRFDGGILEIDIKTKEIVGPVIQNLWMPHNITMINGGLTILESLPGNLLGNNFQVLGNFPAFSRGIAHDGNLYYIGQSRNRNFSKNLGLSKNISIDAGIIIFDDLTKVSRFLQLPTRISEIHAIEVVK